MNSRSNTKAQAVAGRGAGPQVRPPIGHPVCDRHRRPLFAKRSRFGQVQAKIVRS